MTMPHLMNCEHADDGWCLECVQRLGEERQAMLQELRNIANADPSTWEPEVRHLFREWAQSRAREAVAKAEGADHA